MAARPVGSTVGGDLIDTTTIKVKKVQSSGDSMELDLEATKAEERAVNGNAPQTGCNRARPYFMGCGMRGVPGW